MDTSGEASVSREAADAGKAVGVELALTLSQQERDLFALLLDFVKAEALDVELRVAGGWVRDRLLKIASDDIDIALDTMTGAAFAGRLKRWLEKERSKGGAGDVPRGFGIIKQRPEQSKHLETATMQLRGFHIDFVNLRSESYSENSRIPTAVALGTPLEDTLRRDYACNALFFNLRTNRVEDWSGKGISDVFNKVLRTPCEDAQQTFLDDPLRVLRGVRFASTMEFALDIRVAKAASSDATRAALRQRVSRERVGIEFEKMMKPKRRLVHSEVATEDSPSSSQDTQESASKAEVSEKTWCLSSFGFSQAVSHSLRAFLLLQQLKLWSSVAIHPPDGCSVRRTSGETIAEDSSSGKRTSTSLSPAEYEAECNLWGRTASAFFVALKAMLDEASGTRTRTGSDAKLSSSESLVLTSWKKAAISVAAVDAEGAMILAYAAALLPLSDFSVVSEGDKTKKSKREEPLVFKLLSLSLKQPTRVCKAVESVVKASRVFKKCAEEALSSPFDACDSVSEKRVRVGSLIREAGEHWRLGLLLAVADVSGREVSGRVSAELEAASACLSSDNPRKEAKRPLAESLQQPDAGARPEKALCVPLSESESDVHASNRVEKEKQRKETEEMSIGSTIPETEGDQGRTSNNKCDVVSCATLQEVSVASLEEALLAALANGKGNALRLLEVLGQLGEMIREFGLEDAYKLPPLCSGEAIKSALPRISGRQMKDVIDRQVRETLVECQSLILWQLANPTGNVSECIEFLKKEFQDEDGSGGRN